MPRSRLLTGGAFAVGSSTYVVSGLLPAVVAGLHVSLSAAGQLVTAFALTYAVAAPLVATATGRWGRRTLLVVALVLVAAGSAVSAIAVTYPLVIAGRVLAAVGAAAYTPAATLVATQLLGAEHRGRAVAIVFGGLTLAMLIGVPAGSLLGPQLGYRGVFAMVAVIAAASAVAVGTLLPRVAPPPPVGLRARFAVAADRRALTVLAVTVLGVLAAMSVYTYVVPLLGALAGVTGGTVGLLLVAYGLGAVVGNGVGGRATDRWGSRPTLRVVLVMFVVLVATLPLTASTAAGAAAVLFAWSGFTWAVNPPLQNMLLEIAPAGGLLLSLNASAIFVGAGLSGVLGGLVIDTVGVTALPVVAALLGTAALGLMATLRPHRPAVPVASPV